MKKILLLIAITLSVHCIAQAQLTFPFQGGREGMDQFFKNNLKASDDIIQKKATGTVVFKFSANDQGAISKIVLYYADDAILTTPVIEALKKSNNKWIIPGKEKTHDFIIQFAFSFNPPATDNADLQKAVYDNFSNRKPIICADQVPLGESTLLPPVVVNYDIQ